MNCRAFVFAICTVLVAIGPVPSRADDVPKGLKFKNPPSPMTCDVGDPFSEKFYTSGTRGKKSPIKGTLYIICPTRYAKWND